jgi:hypothetical protein
LLFLLRAPLKKSSKKEREISARFRPPSIRAERRGYQRSDGTGIPSHTLPSRAVLALEKIDAASLKNVNEFDSVSKKKRGESIFTDSPLVMQSP